MTDLNNLSEPQSTENATETSAQRTGSVSPSTPEHRQRAPRTSAKVLVLLLGVLLVGAYFRFLNVDWDEGEHLHPDERYMTMVTGAIRLPGPDNAFQSPPAGCASWGGYFDSYCSPLNPYNHQGYGSYAYGTFPLFSARVVGEWLNGACTNPTDPDATPSGLPRRILSSSKKWVAGTLFNDAAGCVGNRFTGYGHIHLLGRMLSALADLGAGLFIFFIGRRLYGPWVGLLAAAFYSLAALPIQQSHFYTVDSFAGFFIAVAGHFVVRAAQQGRWRDFSSAGLTFGLAVACKVSVWPFAAVIALAALLFYVHSQSTSPSASSDGDPAGNGANRILDWLMIMLVVVFCFLVGTIALLGIWSAVKIAFFFGVGLLLIGALAFFVLRPGAVTSVNGATNKRISVDSAFLRLLLAGFAAFLAFRVAQPYAFVGTSFDVNQWQAPEYARLRAEVPDIWYTLDEKIPEPIRSVFLPDPRFIGTLAGVNRQLTGEADVPWGHQWTSRLPFAFPWVNMVVWGMGLPLGLVVWAGWALAGWELWRGTRRMQHFLPWAWATILFFYQGTQWVKSIRYLLPIYPFLILLGAWFLKRLWQKAGVTWRDAHSRLERPRFGLPSSKVTALVLLYRAPLVLVLVATLLWAWGFSRIYAKPVTRNTASRWMVKNIPTAATLHYEVNGEPKSQFLSLPAAHTYTDAGSRHIAPFVLSSDAKATGITFTHLGDPRTDATPESFSVTLSADPTGETVLAQAERVINLELAQHRLGDAQHFELDPVQLRGEHGYYLITQATDGAPVQLNTTVIANEYPDDSLPTRVDGGDPFGNMYRGLESSGDGKTHWDLNEDENKLSQALEWLDEADVIALSSNRGYASIPRLASRYPMAITFYRALFAEELGFDLIATFASYPTIGPFQFPDQETPFPPDEPSLIRDELGSISIGLPPAEEAFSVYDHPQVFLFRKTDTYSRQRVEVILGSADLSQMVWMKPTEATLAPTALMHSEKELEVQRNGGTWTSIFDADAWLNRWPLLSVLVWWLFIQALGLAIFPFLFVAFPGLTDRGWPFAKMLGLLSLATVVWLVASSSAGWSGASRLLTYSRPLICAVLLLLAASGVAVALWRRVELVAWLARERRTILVSELLFTGMFLAFLFIRYGNPDLWHPVMGGERPMDFAYLNAVIKSTNFPPYDPWFSGGYLNYYYFGFVIVGTPIKLLGILPEIAFNLMLPTFFALTGAGASSVAFNLVARGKGDKRAHVQAEVGAHSEAGRRADGDANQPIRTMQSANRRLRPAIYAGLIAALFVAVLGNLSEIGLVAEGLYELGSNDFEFQSTVPGLEPLVVSLNGVVKHTLGGERLPWRPEWPYWNATRTIPHPNGEAPPITEFPFFTFLYSDLHAHLFALPLTIMALAIAMNWSLDAGFWHLNPTDKALRRRRWISALLGLVIGSVVIGSLRPTNFWDYLIYLPIPLVTLAIGFAEHRIGLPRFRLDLATARSGAVAVGGRFAVVTVLGYLIFLPYVNRFATAYSSVELWTGSKTVLWAYLVIHGLFLLPIVTWLLHKSWMWLRTAGRSGQSLRALGAAIPLSAATLFAVVAGYQVALIVIPCGALALLVLISRHSRPSERLVALMAGVGLFATLLVEVVVQKGDISRMNTVFKFYLQVWVLFGIASAVCTIWMALRFRRAEAAPVPLAVNPLSPQPHPPVEPLALGIHETNAGNEPINSYGPSQAASRVWMATLIFFIALAALYPILATRAKINDRWARQVGPGLNSLDWIKTVSDVQEGQTFRLLWDHEALLWLRENIQGSPVVAEGARAQPYRSLRGRVATYTGLPIIIGYPWHQKQQRSYLNVDLVGRRERDVNLLFDTPDSRTAQEILERYDVGLIYVGNLERAFYSPAGIGKFDQMIETGNLRLLYANEGVSIYKVVQ